MSFVIQAEEKRIPYTEPFFIEAAYRFNHLDHPGLQDAVEALAAAGQQRMLYLRFSRQQLLTNARIFGVLRRSSLFPESFDSLIGSEDPYLRACGHYMKGLKAREEGRQQDQLVEAIEAMKTPPESVGAGLHIFALWLKAQAELKLGKSQDAAQTVEMAEQMLARLGTLDDLYGELFQEYAHFMKGEAYNAAGRHKGVETAYQQALDALELRKRDRDPQKRESAQRLENMVQTGLGTLQLILAEVSKKLEGILEMGIAPNGALHYLPFGVLMNARGQYLIDHYSLFHVNSTSLIGIALDRGETKARESRALLALGNPDGTLPAANGEVPAIAQQFPKRAPTWAPMRVSLLCKAA